MSNQDEYIIVNKAQILERIEELNENSHNEDAMYLVERYIGALVELEKIISKSSPLIPEIEKAYEAGKLDKELSLSFDNPKGRYFSLLKLDI